MAKISSVVSWISEWPGFPQSYLGLVSGQDSLSRILEWPGFLSCVCWSVLKRLESFTSIRRQDFPFSESRVYSVHLAVVPGASSFSIMAAL